MSPGKAAAQAGHAYVGALFQAQQSNWEFAKPYLALRPGTKVCLSGTLGDIEKAQFLAQRAGIPHFLVIDSGCRDFYGGEPIVTAFGLGPAPRHIINPVAGKFRLYQ